MPNTPSTGLRVLIVDDNSDCAQSTAMLLRMYGHHPQVAANGQAALKAAQAAHRPDVVLVDIRMPGMDGWTLAKEIKEQCPYDQPYLIAVTGMGREEDRQHSAESGIDLHLTKPVDPEQLRGLLEIVQKSTTLCASKG
jgi:CheY-like chemotaxis protein